MYRPSAVKHTSPEVCTPEDSPGAARKDDFEADEDGEESWMREVWAISWPVKASRRRCPVGRFVPTSRLFPLFEKANFVKGGTSGCDELWYCDGRKLERSKVSKGDLS